MENKVSDMNTAIGWLEKLLDLARRYKIVEWIEVFLVIGVMSTMITIFTHPTEVFEFFKKAETEHHIELLEKRQNTIAQAQTICDRLLLRTGSSRVIGLEMHNSLTGLGGLPFLKASATVQSLDEGVWPVDDQYQNTNLSLVPMASYLYEKGIWYGRPEDLESIDRSMKYRFLSNDVSYVYACTIPGKDKALGYLFITWCDGKMPEDLELAKAEAEKTAIQLGLILELENR